MEEKNDKGITIELIRDILSNVKLVLNITDISKDNLLILYIDMICNKILLKVNRRMFPIELKYIVIDLVKNAYIMYLNDLKGINDIGTSNNSVQSMSEAGRSVSFGATNISNDLANKLNVLAQKQIDENEFLINKKKLLYKT